MIAGVALGPSLLGLFFPVLQAAIFPKEMNNVLYTGAQLGVGLYMFLVGTTLQLEHFKTKACSAMAVSFAGIAAPFLIAVQITPFLVGVPGLFAADISQTNATLFLGACIALTAFPMLARIIHERGLANTSLGTLTLTAGAFDDAASWCVLALVLAAFGVGPGIAVLAIGGGLIWSAFVLLFGRAPGGRGQPHRAGYWGSDELTRFDGADHHQHRSAKGHYWAGLVLDAGAHGRDHDHDGEPLVRAGLRAQGAGVW